VATDGLAAGQTLRTGGAHVIGVHLVKQVGALRQMVGDHAQNRQHDGRQDDVLPEISQSQEPVISCITGQTRHIEQAEAAGAVDEDGEHHDKQSEHGGRDDKEERGSGAEQAVLPLVLALRGVDAERHAKHDGKDCGDRHQLGGGNDTRRKRTVDRPQIRGQSPVPSGDDTGQPTPIPSEDIGVIIDIGQIQAAVDGRCRRAGSPRLVIRARTHETRSQKIRT